MGREGGPSSSAGRQARRRPLASRTGETGPSAGVIARLTGRLGARLPCTLCEALAMALAPMVVVEPSRTRGEMRAARALLPCRASRSSWLRAELSSQRGVVARGLSALGTALGTAPGE